MKRPLARWASPMTEPLDPLRLPLWGSRLIEASAGTGKTWTIAALYLRLVLGHGGPAGFARPLLPSEILVMTFTRAATRELSERIRSRLLEAARWFRGQAPPGAADPFLAELLADHREPAARSAAAWRLSLAAESMDDAAVHTIDAWCQRMLREHAFDSGCLFDEELTANERAMTDEAARDYWRAQVYPLAGAAWDSAISTWRSVEGLADDARQLLTQTGAERAGQGSLGDLIDGLTARRAQDIRRLKAGWPQRAQAMQRWLDSTLAAKTCPFDRRKLAQRYYSAWLGGLAAWAETDGAPWPDLKTGASRLTPSGMVDALKPGAGIALPDDFEAFARLLATIDQLPPLASALRLHAAAQIAGRLAVLKQQAGTYGFADLLARLDSALSPVANPGIDSSGGIDSSVGNNSSGGAKPAPDRLRARILAQYPVALVDEFQDTSPLQARIFDRLYRIADNDAATALLLIGDPKQSIYGFRGADIHSYLGVRQATAGRHYMLATNHRSTQPLVAAVNHLFAQAEARHGPGAFMFRAGAAPALPLPTLLIDALPVTALPVNALPFEPVAARGRPEALCSAAGPVPALTLQLDARLQDARSSQRQFAASCAEQIVTLLNDRQAGFAQAGHAFRRLRPADIAVLVRTGRQAAAVRQALRRRLVASVYLSDQDSVFAGAEAQDLLRWLAAVAAPLDMRRVRAALATRTIGLGLDELARLASDDAAFDARSEQLRQLHQVWLAQGVLPMLRQTLHRLDLPARWLAGGATGPAAGPADPAALDPDGERRLTNVLHLAELLQAASAQLDGEQALIRWLASQIDGARSAGAAASAADEQIVRLESDADLVQVVTVHKSKGLEYPVVLLPFASSFRPTVKARTRFVSAVDGMGQRTLHLSPNSSQLAAADDERLREDLRLLYVALTRARHALWVGVAALKSGHSDAHLSHRSAIGYLLCGAAPVPADALPGLVEAVLSPCAAIVLQRAAPLPAIACTALAPRAALPPLRDSAPYAAQFDRRWAVGSYSLLVHALPVLTAPGPGLGPAGAAAQRDDEGADPADPPDPPDQPDQPDPPDPADRAATDRALPGLAGLAAPAGRLPNAPATPPWHAFPRGALPGNFLHDQLEWLAGEGFALDAAPDLQAQLLARCDRQGWGHQAPQVLAWLALALRTPLPPVGAALNALAGVRPELEFWLPSPGLATAALDALCRQHLLAGCPRPALPERTLHGMLMGFADLVFEHGGRYWVLDYKSNHLGSTDADYSAAALQAAMAQHRYDVQAAIYLLALHRLLRHRLGAAYDPARQLGGAVYYFLRGLQGPANGCHWVAPPLALLDALDTLLASPLPTTP